MGTSLYLREHRFPSAPRVHSGPIFFAKNKKLTAKESSLGRRTTVAAQNLINSSLVSATLRDTSGAVVMCTATNCSM